MQWNKHNKILIMTVIMILIIAGLIMIIVNAVYKIKSPCDFLISEWTAGDLLCFSGSIVAAIAALVGVFLTVRLSVYNYEEDERKRVQPYISITNPYVRSKINMDINFAEDGDEGREGYEEFIITKWYFIIRDGNAEFKTKLKPDEMRKLKNAGFALEELSKGAYVLVANQIVNLPCVMENVGNGVALSMRIKINGKNENTSGWFHIGDIKTHEIRQFNIICLDYLEENIGDYKIEIEYFDIYNNNYVQTCIFMIRDNNGRIEYGLNKEKFIKPFIKKEC